MDDQAVGGLWSAPMSSWSFIHITDIHVGSPRSFRYAPAWVENWRTARRQIIDLRPDLLLIGGDLTRDGSFHRFELEAIRADLETLPMPWHVIPGNMDTGNKHARVSGGHTNASVTFGGYSGTAGKSAQDERSAMIRDDVRFNLRSSELGQFTSVFGTPWWSFDHKGVRFSGFCDILVNSGLPEEAQLWKWLEEQARRPRPAHHVWLVHYPLFADRPDEPSWDIRDLKQYHNWYFTIDQPGRGRLLEVFKATGAEIVLSGHIHCRKQHVAGGIRYYLGPSTAFAQWTQRWPDGDPTPGFQRFVVSDAGITYEFVPLAAVSDAKGYGAGGHVPPDKRDYSQAWEKPATP